MKKRMSVFVRNDIKGNRDWKYGLEHGKIALQKG